MLTLLAVLGVLAIFFVAAAVATREGEVLVDAPADAADLRLPAGPLQPEDVSSVRFGLALRGYRMSEVDEVLDRVQAELAERDARILELEALVGSDAGAGEGAGDWADETAGVAAPGAALLAPVVSSQQVAAAPVDDAAFGGAPELAGQPADEADEPDEQDDLDSGWAFDDGGAVRSAARLETLASAGGETGDEWGMPQVLDLEPADEGLTDAVETPDPLATAWVAGDGVPPGAAGEPLETAPPVADVREQPEGGEPHDAEPVAPAWGGPASSAPDALPPQARPDPFAPTEPFRPAEPLRPADPLPPVEPPQPEDPFPVPAPQPQPEPQPEPQPGPGAPAVPEQADAGDGAGDGDGPPGPASRP